MRTPALLVVLARVILCAGATTLGVAAQASRPTAESAPTTTLGIDVLLAERVELVRGKRVGLLTHPAGVDGRLVPTADRLAKAPGVKLVRLFGPEHGVRGDAPAGEAVPDAVDPTTGAPVVSLYGKTKRPPREALEDLDVLVVDLQDVGVRMYTYLATLGETLVAAAEARKPVIVLDRPNPLGGALMEGPIREPRFEHFLAWGAVPVVHGLTAGEFARLCVAERGLASDLTVVPMKGWRRAMRFEDTGLTWVPTSPHIPRPRQADLYAATAMIGEIATNVSDGLGTTLPFEVLAAPWIEPERFAEALNAADVAGLRFRATVVRPFYGPFAGATLRGAQIHVVDARAVRPLRTALTLLTTLERLHPGRAEFKDARTIGLRWGRDDVVARIRAGASVADMEALWAQDLAAFARMRAAFLLYE